MPRLVYVMSPGAAAAYRKIMADAAGITTEDVPTTGPLTQIRYPDLFALNFVSFSESDEEPNALNVGEAPHISFPVTDPQASAQQAAEAFGEFGYRVQIFEGPPPIQNLMIRVKISGGGIYWPVLGFHPNTGMPQG